MGEHGATFPVQLFASDVSENSLAKARTGNYSEPEMLNVSEERRTRFFNRVEGGYQVKKWLREICVFARHDLTKDPPFSHLDMIQLPEPPDLSRSPDATKESSRSSIMRSTREDFSCSGSPRRYRTVPGALPGCQQKIQGLREETSPGFAPE